MGEYIKVNREKMKLGTCENLYYARFTDLKEIEALGIAPAVKDYLNRAYGFRYRFPFPEEDNTDLGCYADYDKGFSVLLTEDRCPELIKCLRSSDWEHNKITHSASVNHSFNCNISFPCPLSVDFKSVSGVNFSCSGASNVIQICQQKQIDGELWTIIRCGYCGARVRLNRRYAAELADQLRNPLDMDRTRRNYLCKIADRIEAGYTGDSKSCRPLAGKSPNLG